MLDALKRQATGWVAQLLIGLLVLSFAVWGVSGAFTGYQADTVATVGETNVATVDFARQYDQALQNASRQIGQPVTPDQAQLFGLPGQVLGSLVSQATLDDTARQFGLGISSEVLAQTIASDPAFHGPSGGFERIYFTQVLRNNGLNEDQYVTGRRAILLRYQISNALINGGNAPDTYLRALHEYGGEERDISYLLLAAADAGDIGEPDSSALNAYFDENSARWRAPEYRALNLFEVTPSDIANEDEITDEEARASYDANINRYTKPELRRVAQIHFNTKEEADSAVSGLGGEKSFGDIVAERNLSNEDVNLGLVTREHIIDQRVADATFSLEVDTVSGVVEGDLGWFVVRVEEIQPGETRTYSEVKSEIIRGMAIKLATRRIIGTFDEVEDSRAAGETLTEIAGKLGVPLKIIDAVDPSGNRADGETSADVPGGIRVVAGAFASDVDIENDAVRTEEGGYVWYEVTAVTAESDRTLDEVREDVVSAWKQAETEKRLTEKADDIFSRLKTGEPIETIGEKLELDVRTASKLTRAKQPPADLSASVVRATFDGPRGHIAVADGAGDSGSKIVLVVTGTNVPPFDPAADGMAQTRNRIAAQIANDYLQQFLIEKQQELGVSINQISLQAVIGGQTGGQSGQQPFTPPLHGM
jgi:peptidyl-prolyl cis-trans isomerase D